jgi:hypothetical protein
VQQTKQKRLAAEIFLPRQRHRLLPIAQDNPADPGNSFHPLKEDTNATYQR